MSYRDAVLADEPLAYFPLDETDGGDAVDIVSGARAIPRNGTGAVITVGSRQTSLGPMRDFPGTAEHLLVPASETGSFYWPGGDYSLECWIQADQLGQDGIVSQRTSASSKDQGFSLFSGTAGAGVLTVDMGASGTRSTFGYTFPTEELHHLAVTYESGNTMRRMFVDGQQVGYAFKNHVAPSEVPPMYIGLLGGNGSYAWDGVIGHLSLYRKQLTGPQIAAHFSAAFSEQSTTKVKVEGGGWVDRPILLKTASGWADSIEHEVR